MNKPIHRPDNRATARDSEAEICFTPMARSDQQLWNSEPYFSNLLAAAAELLGLPYATTSGLSGTRFLVQAWSSIVSGLETLGGWEN